MSLDPSYESCGPPLWVSLLSAMHCGTACRQDRLRNDFPSRVIPVQVQVILLLLLRPRHSSAIHHHQRLSLSLVEQVVLDVADPRSPLFSVRLCCFESCGCFPTVSFYGSQVLQISQLRNSPTFNSCVFDVTYTSSCRQFEVLFRSKDLSSRINWKNVCPD